MHKLSYKKILPISRSEHRIDNRKELHNSFIQMQILQPFEQVSVPRGGINTQILYRKRIP